MDLTGVGLLSYKHESRICGKANQLGMALFTRRTWQIIVLEVLPIEKLAFQDFYVCYLSFNTNKRLVFREKQNACMYYKSNKKQSNESRKSQ